MSLFDKIKSGVIAKEALENQLARFESDRIDLRLRKTSYGKDLWEKEIKEIDFVIELLKTCIDKYDDLKSIKKEA